MFDLTIISPKRVIFEDAVRQLALDGDDSEYELLSFHQHLLGVLQEGNIVIDSKIAIPIKKGVVQFYENKCLILVEEVGDESKLGLPPKKG